MISVSGTNITSQCIIPLIDDQFTQPMACSVGSIRSQVVHILNVDQQRSNPDFSAFLSSPPAFVSLSPCVTLFLPSPPNWGLDKI